MFGQINWSRWTLLFVTVLTTGLSNGTRPGRSQVVGPTQPAPIISGKWKLDTGEVITVSQDSTGKVTALFTPSVPCLQRSTRSILFSAPLKITGSGDTATAKLESDQFWACTRTPAMVTECGVQELFMTKFRATVGPFSITGEVLRPHYDFEMVGGRRTNCRRNAAKDGWAPFSLTPLCRPATPWFDKDTNCPDAQRPVITTSPGHVVLSICGSEIYRHSFDHQPYLEEYAAALVERVKQQIGSTVCCQSFRNALRSGEPCNPGSDVDCDGRPNQTDEVADAPFPDINIFSSPPGASVAPFPAGLDPDDPDFLPGSTARASRGVGDCDCKWELIKGVLNCGTGGQQHSYVATWRCPTTGAEVITTKYATANTPCP
ncbi:MAG: hypothetical protein ND866_11130 [Pyrinomonadaceae bacterium]|nr:hypothetical protein [Pyrinomonadaceae bacterium]